MQSRGAGHPGNSARRVTELPGAQRLAESANQLRERADELQRRLRGLEALERRVDALERKVDQLSKAKAPSARKSGTTRRATSAKTEPKPKTGSGGNA